MKSFIPREETLFDEVRKLTDARLRSAYLDEHCADDEALREKVERMLDLAVDAETFFADVGMAISDLSGRRNATWSEMVRDGAAAHRLDGEESVGSRIGRYKLVEKIGEGGCGVVFMAEQEEPVRRRVALKIIKLGMETRSVIGRFEAERQALAMMDHPNIARVFDAGATARGSPYFVMELVQGQRITTYCDEQRLDLRERLDLFVHICHAIQHAHQKGIIHRDIKPSNILVALHDGGPVPKVIDFGIAKATEVELTDKFLVTAFAPFIGTPAYMSPEQAAMGGVDIDTRSDIYSLGVLLYELLTGRTPFDAKQLTEVSLDEMRKTLLEREPLRPAQRLQALDLDTLAPTAAARSTDPARLMSAVKGDLEWIVLKALEKDRKRRYETANSLALDVLRFLHDDPVSARPPSWLYQFQKLVRRNRVIFIAGGAVTAALAVGFGTSTWLFLREREARHRAVAAEHQQGRLRHEAEMRERVTQAALLVSQNRFDEADRLLDAVELEQPTVEGAAVLRALGEWHALHQRWREAADHFALLLRVNQLDGVDVSSLDFLELGPVLVELADASAYDAFREGAIARFADAPGPFADRVVKISLLRPANAGLLAALVPFAEASARSVDDAVAVGDTFREAWGAISLALWEFRRGDLVAAERWCERCLRATDFNAPRTVTARAILAMVRARQGRADEVRRQLDAAQDVIESKYRANADRGTPVQGFWFDWAFARILMDEALKQQAPVS